MDGKCASNNFNQSFVSERIFRYPSGLGKKKMSCLRAGHPLNNRGKPLRPRAGREKAERSQPQRKCKSRAGRAWSRKTKN